MRNTLIVDGYNVIHAWPRLRAVLGTAGLEDARGALVAALADYAVVRQVRVVVVFDGSGGRAGASEGEVVDGVEVRFSRGGVGGSADHLIERLANEAARAGGAERVMVATSDRLQRDLVRAMGVASVDAGSLEVEVAEAAAETGAQARRRRDEAGFARRVEHHLTDEVRRRLEMLRRGRTAAAPAPTEPETGTPPTDETGPPTGG